jgi:hypothetical protein
MPFTISHVAAVLPARRWLRHGGLFSAAVIGSMAPDFGVLLPLHLSRAATHGARALLSFCLPACNQTLASAAFNLGPDALRKTI